MLMVLLFLSVSITFQFFSPKLPDAHAFSNQVIQRGATGDDVIELQSRLQYNGYYHGTIDGVYGWSTYWAARNFQHQFGLEEIDGLVGQKTKDKLTNATKYYKSYVYEQLKAGRDFTHYGGVPLSIQSAPSPEVRAKAKQQAEARKLKQEQQYKSQAPSKPQPKQPQPQQQEQAKQPQQQEQAKQPQQQEQAKQPQQQEQAKQPQQQEQAKQQQEQQQQEQQQEQQQPQPQQEPEPQPEQEEAQPDNTPQQEEQNPTAANMPEGFSQNDIQLMANAVYGEARGEPYIGQVAIAAVIINRVNSPTFPNTVSGVIFEPRAFTAVADGQII